MNAALPYPLAATNPAVAPFIGPAGSSWLGATVILLLLLVLARAIRQWERRMEQTADGRDRLLQFVARGFEPRILPFFVGVLSILFVGVGVVSGIGHDAEKATHPSSLRMLAAGIATYGGVLLLVYGLLRRNRLDGRPMLGWDVHRGPRDAARAFGFYVLIVPGGLLVNLVYQVALLSLGVEPKTQETVNLMVSDLTPAARLSLTLLIVVLAPVAEEIVFRGVLLPTLAKKIGLGPSVFLVSAAFALIHLNTASIALLFYLGAAMSIAYIHTGKIVTPIVIHAAFNAVNLALLFVLGR